MRTAVDTNVLSLYWSGNERFRDMQSLLVRCAAEGAVMISGIVYAELLAHPRAGRDLLSTFLQEAGIAMEPETGAATWETAGRAYSAYCRQRRSSGGGESKRLLADFVIGAHAQLRADRLATLDQERYRAYFPELVLIP
ncbi:MAG: type II toxin-antitoxin system VapC family toxin [Acidobacteria bacterium]|nr:MAG: type II toxin-antitoxin system VapC family toxin [Acidobacteriota bacterium]